MRKVLQIIPLAFCFSFSAIAYSQGDQPEPPDDFYELLATIESSLPSEHTPLVEAFIRAFGKTPVIKGNEAIFFAKGNAAGSPRILGDFNDWGGSNFRLPLEGGEMTPIADSGWHYFKTTLLPDARIEYLLVIGGQYRTDPLNSDTTIRFGRIHSEVRMPAYKAAPEFVTYPMIPKGRVISADFESDALKNIRKVHIYLPPGYEGSDNRYPTVYFNDGTIYLEAGQVPHILDYAIAHKAIQPVIAVLVDPVVRGREYRRDPSFRQFFTQEMIPFIDRSYRTRDSAQQRAIIGGSRGALAATDMAL